MGAVILFKHVQTLQMGVSLKIDIWYDHLHLLTQPELYCSVLSQDDPTLLH